MTTEEESVKLVGAKNNDILEKKDTGGARPKQRKEAGRHVCFGIITLALIFLVSLLILGHRLIFGGGLNNAVQTSKQSAESTVVDSSPRDAIVQQQIESFRNGTGIMVNLHITHCGGTTFCREIGHRVRSPSFACLKARGSSNQVSADYPKSRPWTWNDTTKNIKIVKQYFDMISWEFSRPPTSRLLQIPDTDWENPKLLSVIIMRDPLSRLLAGDGNVHKYFPNLKQTGALEDWWRFAHYDKVTDNFALRVLAGPTCCNGTNTDPIHLQNAKALVERFTFVLDIACLDLGMTKLAEIVGIDMDLDSLKDRSKTENVKHPPPSERIPHKEVYDFLVEKNHLDTELYQWSKSLALVNCSALAETQQEKPLVP